MGKGGSLSDGVLRKIVLSYAYVGVWIFLSFTVIVYNKYILDRKIHMSFCSSLTFLLVRVFKIVDPVSMSRDLYLSSVVPIGALYALSLFLHVGLLSADEPPSPSHSSICSGLSSFNDGAHLDPPSSLVSGGEVD